MPGQTKDSISLLDPHNGTIIKTLLLEEIHRKNAGTGIFDLNWTHIGQDDKYHPNDADPLTYSLVDQFVNFNEGDLLISYRHADLVYVLDPVTMKVKWWTQGLTSGQHDPDWQPDGSITVFDNAVHTNQRVNIQRFSDFRYNNGNSPPRSFRSEVIFDGGLSRLFTATRGRHQINRNGTLIMVVPDQGRAIAFSKDGHLLLDFINWYDEGRVLHLNNAEFIERELVEIKNFSACKSK